MGQEAQATSIVEKLSKIDNIVAKYDDVLSSIAPSIKKENCPTTVDDLKKVFNDMALEDKDLVVGFVGRVKAGKSSLQNALFFNGRDILPKAATPMTASLTVMRHGNECKAVIECYTQPDIDGIKKSYDAYNREAATVKTKVIEEEKEREKKRQARMGAKGNSQGSGIDSAKIDRLVDGKMKENPLRASYDHYNEMLKSSNGRPTAPGKDIVLNASTPMELMGKLAQYVGAGGNMTPYTKSVELYLTDFPEGIRVVDTPGLDDPVQSRVERTEQYLKECDVIFIVSPAGQFISDKDMQLMQHISNKEGIREIYLVASKVDDLLFSSEKDDANGDLNLCLSNIRKHLYEHAMTEIVSLNRSIPPGRFDKIVKGGEDRLILTSAICYNISSRYNDHSSWDEGMTHAWELLSEEYPDDFSEGETSKINLDKVANILEADRRVKDTLGAKKEIIEQKQAGVIDTWTKNVDSYAAGLLQGVEEGIAQIQNTDSNDIEEKKGKIALIRNGKDAVDDAFQDSVEIFNIQVGQTIDSKCSSLYEAVRSGADSSRETKTETVTKTRNKAGFFAGVARFLNIGGTESYDTTQEYTAVRVGPVKSMIGDFVRNLEDTLESSVTEARVQWKKSVQHDITQAIREVAGDDDIDTGMLKRCLRSVVNKIEPPNIDLSSHKFTTSASGAIRDDEAEMFLDQVHEYLGSVYQDFMAGKKQFLNSLSAMACKEHVGEGLFSNMEKEVADLEEKIANKKSTLERYNQCLTELKAL